MIFESRPHPKLQAYQHNLHVIIKISDTILSGACVCEIQILLYELYLKKYDTLMAGLIPIERKLIQISHSILVTGGWSQRDNNHLNYVIY